MKIFTSVGKFIAVAAVAFCVGYFCARFYVAPPASSADCAAWAGAFGTVAAFFGTVWIATSAERKVIKQEHARAVVAAASILPSIESMSGAIELAELMLGNENIKVVGDFSSDLLRILSAPVPWANEDIVPLLAIPGSVATSLARAGATYKLVLMQAQSIARFGEKSNADLTLVFQTMLAAPIRKVQIRLEKAQGDLTRFLDIAEPPL